MNDAPQAANAARRGGVLGTALSPLVAAVGVVLLAVSSGTWMFVTAGVSLIVLATLIAAIGACALRRRGPAAALDTTAGIIAAVGAIATIALSAFVPVVDVDGAGFGTAIVLALSIAACWWIAHMIARALRAANDSTSG